MEKARLEAQLDTAVKDRLRAQLYYDNMLEELTVQISTMEREKENVEEKKLAKLNSLDERIEELTREIDELDIEQMKKEKQAAADKKQLDAVRKEFADSLECPVCLELCQPPVQIMQCPEGHILCKPCADNPQLQTCPQCRILLRGRLSRCRALEELARKSFTPEQPLQPAPAQHPLPAAVGTADCGVNREASTTTAPSTFDDFLKALVLAYNQQCDYNY